MAVTRRQYAGAASATTTTSDINTVQLSVTIASTVGWPSTAGVQFWVVFGPEAVATLEKCLVTISGSTLTIITGGRGGDGTTAVAHASGTTVYPVLTSQDADEANTVAAAFTAGINAAVATFIATPSSANLAATMSDETGTGSAVFATSPTLVTPILGNASATSIVASGSANNRVTQNLVLYGVTTDAATAVELTTNGAAGSGVTNRIVVPVDTAMSVVVNICVKQNTSANAKQMLRQFLIVNSAGTTSIQGAVTVLGTDVGSAGLATVTTTITANDTNDAINIVVNGVLATNLSYTAYLVSTETKAA